MPCGSSEVRFLVDRCAGSRLAQWLRDQGHDVVESRERGPDPGDRAILRWAVAEDRILITMDKDFGALVYLERTQPCGLIRLPDVPAGRRIALIERLVMEHSHDLLQRAVITVRGDRIRISHGPWQAT
jgi:predicted nuclease of predicted toxin-antitoxin system